CAQAISTARGGASRHGGRCATCGCTTNFGKLRRSREGDLPLRSLPAIALACAVLSLSFMSAVVQGRPTASTRPASFDIEAHRGGRALRPENTLQSFANALSMGVDTLELDMGVTKDGVIIVSHERGLNPDLA